MTEVEMVNAPVEFALGGRKLRFRKASFIEEERIAQELFLGRAVAEIRIKAGAFSDEKAAVEYVREAVFALPSGEKLREVALKLLIGDKVADEKPDHEAVAKCLAACIVGEPAMTSNAMDELLRLAAPSEVQAVFAWVYGSKKGSASPPPTSTSSPAASPQPG